ncbi:MAG: hypothetical protein ED859_15015 [Desulfuromonadales bacterium]|nr:MAG: hypothetical protein ED859_15015 [Desulfuromonadales bacterium]
MSSEILEILCQMKDILNQRYHVSDIALFGSQARGDATEKSDIDVLIKFEGDVQLEIREEAKDYVKTQLETTFQRHAEVIDEDTIFMPIIRKIIKSGALYA